MRGSRHAEWAHAPINGQDACPLRFLWGVFGFLFPTYLAVSFPPRPSEHKTTPRVSSDRPRDGVWRLRFVGALGLWGHTADKVRNWRATIFRGSSTGLQAEMARRVRPGCQFICVGPKSFSAEAFLWRRKYSSGLTELLGAGWGNLSRLGGAKNLTKIS